MQTDRRRLLSIGAACVVSALAGVAAVAVTGDPVAGLVGFAGALYVCVIVAVAGMLGTILAALLLTALPSVVGESSALLSFVCVFLAAVILFLTTRNDTAKVTGAMATSGLLFLILAAAMVLVGGGTLPLVYVAAGLFVVVAMRRPAPIRAMITAMAMILAPLVLSYAATLILGFTGRLITSVEIGTRTIEVYLPFTLATSGPPFISGSRRMTLLVGEPGLAVFFLTPILAVLLMSKVPRLAKLAGLVAIGVAGVFGQSFAALVALGVMLATYFVVVLAARWRHPVLAVLIGGGAAAVAIPIVYDSLVLKAGVAAESVTDRGILNAGNASAASLGNINLIVAFQNNPALAGLLAIALLLTAALTIRSAETAGLWVAFAMTAVFAQPSQWQVGGWVLLVLVSIIDRNRREAISTSSLERDAPVAREEPTRPHRWPAEARTG